MSNYYGTLESVIVGKSQNTAYKFFTTCGMQLIPWDEILYICVQKKWWRCAVFICDGLFQNTLFLKRNEARQLMRLAGYTASPKDELMRLAYVELCKSATEDVLKKLAFKKRCPTRYYYIFLDVYVETVPIATIATHFRAVHRGLGYDFNFQFHFIEKSISTGNVGLLAQLRRHNLISTTLLTIVLETGRLPLDILSWAMCCDSKLMGLIYANDGLDRGIKYKDLDKLFVFGLWTHKFTCNHVNSLRRNMRYQALQVLKQPRGNILDLLLEHKIEKQSTDHVADVLYMCIFRNKMESLESVMEAYELDLATFPYALHWAVRSRKLKMLKFVGKSCRHQVNSLCEFGFTPLILAIFTDKPKLVKYFLASNSIDTYTPSTSKLTAHDYARDCANTVILQLLRTSKQQDYKKHEKCHAIFEWLRSNLADIIGPRRPRK